MSIDWNQVATEWHNSQPHPLEPRLTVGEFTLAVKLATKSKFGGHASPHEAAAFMTEFKDMNHKLTEAGKAPISPEEYTQVLDRLAPHSFAYHGRPPSMNEIVRHRDAEPSTVQKYYGDLPDQHYPTVKASDMAKFLHLAEEPALRALGRRPAKSEAAQFAHGGFNFAGIGDFYKSAADNQGGQPASPPPQGPPQAPGDKQAEPEQ